MDSNFGPIPDDLARQILSQCPQKAPSVDSPASEPESEKAFMWRVINEAEANGWRYWHNYNAIRSGAGWPDLFLLRGPRMIVAELKKVGKKPSKAQEEWLAAFSEIPGAEVFVWTPESWLEIVRTLSVE